MQTYNDLLRQEGRQEGLLEGQRAVLLRLLTKKFGAVSPAVQQRLQAASDNELNLWADRILLAGSLEDVFEPAE
jgi:hypothetical protein